MTPYIPRSSRVSLIRILYSGFGTSNRIDIEDLSVRIWIRVNKMFLRLTLENGRTEDRIRDKEEESQGIVKQVFQQIR